MTTNYEIMKSSIKRYDKEKFEVLLGKTLLSIEGGINDEEMIFTTSSGEKFILTHDNICCERVSIEDIVGDVTDLIGVPILLAEEVVGGQDENLEGCSKELDERQYSFTWTFYKLSTIKGSVTIRWYGQSNGCYSEKVDFFSMRKINS